MENRNRVKDTLYDARLHYFALVTAIASVVLIVAGALVTSTHSGDSVPDWPLAYGSLTPPMVGGIVFEYSHRVIAGLTSLLVGILAIWLWMVRPRRKIRWLGLAAFLAVLAQAVLGGLRVLVVTNAGLREFLGHFTGTTNFLSDRLFFATAHGILGQTVLILLFAITLFLSESWIRHNKINAGGPVPGAGARWISLLLFGVVFVQLVLGTLIRHANAALVIPDFPLSFGKIIPPFGNLPAGNGLGFSVLGSDFIFKVALQFSHRVTALVILILAVYLFVAYRKTQQIGGITGLLLALVGLQVILGALNIWIRIPVYTTVPHVAVGALILAVSLIWTLWVWRFHKEGLVPNSIKKESFNKAEPAVAG